MTKNRMEMTTYITSDDNVSQMVAALEVMPHVKITRSETDVVGKHERARKEVLRAMIGSTGSYLVRHPIDLWLCRVALNSSHQ